MHKVCFFERVVQVFSRAAQLGLKTQIPHIGWICSALSSGFWTHPVPQIMAGTGFVAICFGCNLCPDGGSPKLLLHLIAEVPGSLFPSLPHTPPSLSILFHAFSSSAFASPQGMASALLSPRSHLSAVVFKNKTNKLLNEKAIKTNK